MKTRFMCLVLCALMLFSAFLTGCANTKSDSEVTDDIVDKASNNATTLTMGSVRFAIRTRSWQHI